ncbi:hypothetical protein ACFWBF_18225 [Streptomyces sp. NPDC060028]|uniref:hypothetical protein n=1 Tax=Streptomyces sp. NPDC060028 TaxID=3347041 RepID=UPI00369F15B3
MGYWPKEADPIVKWVEAHLLHDKFMDVYGYKLYDVFVPEETVRMPPPPRALARP